MAPGGGKLTAMAVKKLKAKGRYADGNGLYLQISASGSKSWLFRYMLNGRARAMGLGSVERESLAGARAAALEAHRLLREGIDPIEHRKAQKLAARLEAAQTMTFAECAAAYIEAHRAGWRNAKHAAQWESTIKTYAEPVIGALPVQQIDLGLVLKVLEPIWMEKPETASRLRGRIEAILDWATVRGYRKGDNPARWRGHLDKLLPKRSRVRQVSHHAALPYSQMGAFMAALRQREGVAARAFEFAILTASRTGEVLNARWQEIDLEKKVWTVPGERMKTGREHRVPLSPRCMAILAEMAQVKCSDYVFPGTRPKKPLSNMVFLQLLRRMGRSDLTAHGFRSSFRDWAAEQTSFPREVVEAALAHAVGDKVEAAYRRGDLFVKRRKLMEAWDGYCARKPAEGTVVPIGKLEKGVK